MALERVRRDAKKDVDETVVADFREKCLLITECVGGDDLRCRVGNLDGEKVVIGIDAADSC